MQFIPIVERKTETPLGDGLVLIQPTFSGKAEVTDWSVEPRAYGGFLTRIFDEWVRRDVGRFYVQHFDVALESWMGLSASLCVFSKTCGSALAMEHTGDVYSCDHYVYPEYKLGNLSDTSLEAMASSPPQQAFGNDKLNSLPKMCLDCSVRFACNGECPKHRFLTTPDGEPGLNYLCAGYKHFFCHIDPYMRFMAGELKAERAPANVMHMIAEADRLNAGGQKAATKLGRNSLCLCGSGKKAKHCCGLK